jgi:Trk K+ transport system NAD-binding subunit
MEIYDFPHEGVLLIKLIYIIYPFIGLVLVGLGIVEFGMFTFAFRYRVTAWNEWLAEEMSNHTILVGAAGNVGTRIVKELVDKKVPACLITKETERHQEDIEQMTANPGVAVIFGDASRSKTLQLANVSSARACIIVTNDEMLNFRIAIKAKEINPNIKTVVRVFDPVFGNKITNVYGIDATISTSAMSAPAFVAQTLEEGILHILRSEKHGDFYVFEVTLNKKFQPISVEFLEEKHNLTILAVNGEAHPEADNIVKSFTKILLLGSLSSINQIKSTYCDVEVHEDLIQLKNYVILVSISGNVGARVLEELVRQKIPTCVITRGTRKYKEEIHELLGNSLVDVIIGNAYERIVLENAKISEARAIIIVDDDDMLNFRIAVLAKKLNPKIRTVIRSFDRIFGQKITEVHDVDSAISTSAITAPAFVAQSFEKGIIQTLHSKKYQTDFHLIAFHLNKEFDPIQVESLEERHNITILAVNEEVHPEADDLVTTGSKLLILSDLDSIRDLRSEFCV